MIEQKWLPGMEPSGLSSLLFVLKPDDAEREQVEAVARGVRRALWLDDIPFPPSRYHLTTFAVGFFEELPREIVRRAEQVGEALRAMPFQLRLDKLDMFGRPGPRGALVLRPSQPIPSLDAFLASLREGLRREHIARFARSSVAPHLTLYYRSRRVKARAVPPVILDVRRLFLIQSHIGEGRHTEIASWAIAP